VLPAFIARDWSEVTWLEESTMIVGVFSGPRRWRSPPRTSASSAR
jgi:hypothetical protein